MSSSVEVDELMLFDRAVSMEEIQWIHSGDIYDKSLCIPDPCDVSSGSQPITTQIPGRPIGFFLFGYSTESKLSVASGGQQQKQGFMAPLSNCDVISQRRAERFFWAGYFQ